ncbi:DUF3347 domain-containing protein [Mucilaginibacter calamicampi]|uniref:DUF3347 domain-containing protein n=1 Tax=Mucilaginibacter calamicampi TaxID=1302352 RepID=A0ABW2YYY0_9SPHI
MKIAKLLLVLPVMLAYTASAQNLRDALSKVTEDYTNMRNAIEAGNATRVTENSQGFIWDVRAMHASEMSDAQRRQWIGHLDKLMMACRGISQGRNLDAQKLQFSELSAQFFQTLKLFNLNKKPVYKLSCSGNVWLTQSATVSNPYVAKADKNKKCGNIDDILNVRK